MESDEGEPRSPEIRKELASAAHDLNNLLYRLSILSENLQGAISEQPAREEARDLLSDTSRRLSAVVERLRRLSRGEA